MGLDQVINASKGVSNLWQLAISVLQIFLASSFVLEIVPIKINPIKTFFGWVSKGFKSWFADVIDDSLEKSLADIKEEDKKRDTAVANLTNKLDNIFERVDNITTRIDENEARAQSHHISDIRRSILGFANQLRDGMDASKESFDDILEQYDEYQQYVEANALHNGRMDLSIKFIRDRYDEQFNHVIES